MRSFEFYGRFSVSNFKKIIDQYPLDWDEWDFRQKKFHVHKETKSLPIIFSEKQYNAFNSENDIIELVNQSKTSLYPIFEGELVKLETHLKQKIGDGFIFRAMLVMLPSGKSVLPHVDKGTSFNIPKRLHIPIKTNRSCYFTVGEITKILGEGEVWEINNNGIRHGVSNLGDTDRIHLIVDWVNK
jgi:hypothetical protein